jgi:GH18 family chitinase
MGEPSHIQATCRFLKKEYSIVPMQTWGDLTDPVLMKWWDDNACNELSESPPPKIQTSVYLESWIGLPSAPVQGIDRVAVAFASFRDDGSIVPPGTDVGALRALLPAGAKILLSIGGWGSAAAFRLVFQDWVKRRKALGSLRELAAVGWDGFDIDWEYPQPDDLDSFVSFLEDVRTLLPGTLLTIAASANERYYEGVLKRLSATLDSIYLMTYDFSGPWSSRTGHNSSLFDAADTVNRFIAAGADPAKLVVGCAFYGRAVSVRDSTLTGLGVQTVGDWSDESYKTIQAWVNSGGFVRSWDQDKSAPTLFERSQARFVTYEDAEVIALKRELVAKRGLQGVMAWSFHHDNGTLMKALCGVKE